MYQFGQPKIDSIQTMEGKFRYYPQVDKEPVIELKMAYLDSSTKCTYGFIEAGPNLLSPKTLEAFRAFMESAEEDVGQVVSSGGVIAPFGEVVPNARNNAESDRSPELPKGLGEE